MAYDAYADAAIGRHIETGADRRARAVRRARRHSLAVRAFKFILPLGAVGIFALFLVSVLFTGPTEIGPVTVDAIRIDEGALVMENPRMTGLDRNARAYALRADQASQRLDNSNQVDLTGIDATLAVDETQDATVKATGGTFDQDAEILTLFDGVTVTTTTGYVAELEAAEVDLNTGTVVTDRPVEIDMLNGVLNAGGMEITQNGEVLKFSGPVRLNMRMQGNADDGN